MSLALVAGLVGALFDGACSALTSLRETAPQGSAPGLSGAGLGHDQFRPLGLGGSAGFGVRVGILPATLLEL